MKRVGTNLVVGLLLVAFGALLLVQNVYEVNIPWDILMSLVFAAGGLIFLSLFVSNRSVWWPLIPGFTLLGLASVILLETVAGQSGGTLGGMVFLGAIGLGFFAVYWSQARHWWAIIPGGVLLTLAAVAGLSDVERGDEPGVLFLGLGLTFGLVYLAPTPRGRMIWALIPAAVLGVMGMLAAASSRSSLNYVWSVALILGGLYWVYRSVRPRPAHRPAAPAADSSDGEPTLSIDGTR